MKKLLATLAIAALSFALPVSSAAQEEENYEGWIDYDTTDEGSVIQIHSDSFAQGSSSLRAVVWIRVVKINGDFHTVRNEVNCPEGTWRAVQHTYENTEGDVDTWRGVEDWAYVLPGSLGGFMHEFACYDSRYRR